MNDLERCLELNRQIASYETIIKEVEMEIRYPQTTKLSDTAIARQSRRNVIEKYIERKEKYENAKLECEIKLNKLWLEINPKMDKCGISTNEKKVMLLRYKNGLPWKKCTAIMKEIVGEYWTENLTFKTNRKVKKALEKCKI